jgi:curved DNA-binding protein CbpA
MTTEYKQKNELPDLYNILGLTIDVCNDPACNEVIRKAYTRKAKACHPDRHPGRKDVEEVFELITSAYDILKDEKQRTEYNHKLSLNRQSSSDFIKLKKSANEYMESIGEYKPATDQQKLEFKEKMSKLDSKHGYDPDQTGKIADKDARNKINDMNSLRAQQDRDFKPEKLFDDGRFDQKLFNAAFDKVHKKEDTTIITHNGVPSAWNDHGTVANFSTFDNLDNLYVEDGNRNDISRQNYGSTDFGAPMKKVTKDELNDLIGASYVDQHNVLGDDYYKTMKDRLRDRKQDATKFDKMTYGDFKRDDTAGYGIFDQLGCKFDDRLSLDVDEDDISKKYEKIMAERQQDLIPGANPPPLPTNTSGKKKSSQASRR